MTNTLLHIFKDDLLKRPLPGFMSGTPLPPRVILAKDLDENNKTLTLLAGEGDPKLYEVKYTKDGTVITSIFPFPEAPSGTAMHVLTISDGVLAWTATEDCDQ